MPATILDFLAGLTSGVLTVPLVSWILNNWLANATVNQKKLTAYAVSFLLGTAAFFGLAWFKAEPLPLDPQALLNGLWPVWTAAFAASQAVLMGAKKVGIAK